MMSLRAELRAFEKARMDSGWFTKQFYVIYRRFLQNLFILFYGRRKNPSVSIRRRNCYAPTPRTARWERYVLYRSENASTKAK